MSLLLLFIYLFIIDLDFFKKDFTTFHVGACPIRPFKRQRNVMKFTQNLMKSLGVYGHVKSLYVHGHLFFVVMILLLNHF